MEAKRRRACSSPLHRHQSTLTNSNYLPSSLHTPTALAYCASRTATSEYSSMCYPLATINEHHHSVELTEVELFNAPMFHVTIIGDKYAYCITRYDRHSHVHAAMSSTTWLSVLTTSARRMHSTCRVTTTTFTTSRLKTATNASL